MSRLKARISKLEFAASQDQKLIVIPISTHSDGEAERRKYFAEHPELDADNVLIVLIRRFATER